jgi:hypothetical protein
MLPLDSCQNNLPHHHFYSKNTISSLTLVLEKWDTGVYRPKGRLGPEKKDSSFSEH